MNEAINRSQTQRSLRSDMKQTAFENIQ